MQFSEHRNQEARLKQVTADLNIANIEIKKMKNRLSLYERAKELGAFPNSNFREEKSTEKSLEILDFKYKSSVPSHDFSEKVNSLNLNKDNKKYKFDESNKFRKKNSPLISENDDELKKEYKLNRNLNSTANINTEKRLNSYNFNRNELYSSAEKFSSQLNNNDVADSELDLKNECCINKDTKNCKHLPFLQLYYYND